MGNPSKIIIYILSFGVGLGQLKDPVKRPVLKSAILPGWGQAELGEPKRAKTYFIAEGALLLSWLGAYSAFQIQKTNYIAFAANHAQISTERKDHRYWVDIGNFSSIESYNAEHLRNRDIEGLYPRHSIWDWHWDREENRKHFERMRINSDLWELGSTFILGGIVVTHIISAIDALYLKRIRAMSKVTLTPEYDGRSGLPGFRLSYHFR